jgi:hypothetical protein
MVSYRKIFCLNEIDKGTHKIVCGTKIGDVSRETSETERYCQKCDISWNVKQTSDGNFILKREAPDRLYDFDGTIMEKPNGK